MGTAVARSWDKVTWVCGSDNAVLAVFAWFWWEVVWAFMERGLVLMCAVEM